MCNVCLVQKSRATLHGNTIQTMNAEQDANDSVSHFASSDSKNNNTTNVLTNDHAAYCKQATYELCIEIDHVLKSTQDVSLCINRDKMQSWVDRLKDANRSISRYVRTVNIDRDRLVIEAQITKHAMFMDILDREATFTETLNTICETEESDKVTRQMRFLSSMNGSLSTLSHDHVDEGSGNKECITLRDEATNPTH